MSRPTTTATQYSETSRPANNAVTEYPSNIAHFLDSLPEHTPTAVSRILQEKPASPEVALDEEDRLRLVWRNQRDAWFRQRSMIDEKGMFRAHVYTFSQSVHLISFIVRARSPSTPKKLLHDATYETESLLIQQRKLLDEIESMDSRDALHRVYCDELRQFWDDSEGRLKLHIHVARSIPSEEFPLPASAEQYKEYCWTISFRAFIEEEIGQLLTEKRSFHSHVSRVSSMDPFPRNESYEDTPIQTLSNAKNTRGPGETSNTRVLVDRNRRTNDQRPLGANRNQPPETTMSSVTSYKATLSVLAAVGFLGASITWSAVFTGTRGDIVLLAWASTCFICGSAAAGSMGILVDSDTIDFDRDMVPRRVARMYSIFSATFILAGILLTSLTMAWLGDVEQEEMGGYETKTRQAALRGSGYGVIGVVFLEVMFAIFVRMRYSHRVWRF
ncbi:hypothetical protein DL96DRAFT_1620626 [Flagelloscypha sp. PMI_526]|nr:hypothetical protein DL96DRAFT_1620626 [Flagelloscypha sp. PMI_526]